MWSSIDALAWESASTIDPPPFNDLMGGGSAARWQMDDVVEYGGRLVGLGAEGVGCCDGTQMALWHSTDGRTWTNEPTRGSSIDTYETPADAAVAPDGTLIVAATGGLGSSTTVWSTRDGRLWEEHPFSEVGSDARIDGLAASPDLMLAVGTGPGVWTSSDGRTWTARDAPPGAGDWLRDVAYDAAGDRFVVAGMREDDRAGVWFTRDGTSWTGATLSDGPGYTTSVGVGGGVIALGGAYGPLADSVATAWSSHDGVTWRYVHLGRGHAFSIEVGDDGTAVMTALHHTRDDHYLDQVWTGRLSQPR